MTHPTDFSHLVETTYKVSVIGWGSDADQGEYDTEAEALAEMDYHERKQNGYGAVLTKIEKLVMEDGWVATRAIELFTKHWPLTED